MDARANSDRIGARVIVAYVLAEKAPLSRELKSRGGAPPEFGSYQVSGALYGAAPARLGGAA